MYLGPRYKLYRTIPWILNFQKAFDYYAGLLLLSLFLPSFMRFLKNLKKSNQ